MHWFRSAGPDGGPRPAATRPLPAATLRTRITVALAFLAWLDELVLAAQDLTCWLQTLLLDGELAIAEPKRLRTRLLHTAGRLPTHARRPTLHLPAAWPWATCLATAFTRLWNLPPHPG